MPTLAAGASFNQAVSAGNSVRIQTTHNVSGRIRFVPSSTELPPPPNSSRSFGPLPIDQTFGPWGMPGTVFVDCDPGSATTLTYTVNDDAMPQVAITGGSINGTIIGATSQAAGTFTALRAANLTGGFRMALVDVSGTPGNATSSSCRGRAAFAAGTNTVTITSTAVAANSTVLISLGGTDATLTSVRVTPGAGSFTVTGNANATGTTPFDWFLVLN